MAQRDPDSTLLHVMRRTTFGFSPDEWEAARELGWEAWLETQLQPETLDDSAVEAAIADEAPTVFWSLEELEAALQGDELQPAQVGNALVGATLYRALYSPRRLYELVVDFWSNHFNIHQRQSTVLTVLKTIDDREVIRPHAFGRFRDLLGASAHSPAMLNYLDNASNRADGPNENYARELMELHTLSVSGGYTEEDVREVARCFTGWGIGRRGSRRGRFQFYPRHHDDGSKTVLGTLIPAGGGEKDGEQVLDLLAAHPSTAEFIAFKLCRRLVADQPPDDLVATVAARFRATDGDIRETLRTLLFSDAFLDSADAKFRRPMEYLCSLAKALDLDLDARGLHDLGRGLRDLGQSPFAWSPPTGYPDVASAWDSTAALLGRWNHAWFAARSRRLGADFSPYTQGADSPEVLADRLIDGLLHRPMAEADRRRVVDYLAAGGRRFTRLAPDAAALILAASDFQYR